MISEQGTRLLNIERAAPGYHEAGPLSDNRYSGEQKGSDDCQHHHHHHSCPWSGSSGGRGETEAQYALLKKYGADYIQGFLFSKPLPAEDFVEYFHSMKGQVC